MSIRMEDIPYNLHGMVEIIGMDTFEELVKIYGGTLVYIPVYKRIIIPERNRKILEEYNGNNLEDLRHKYNLCSHHEKGRKL